MINKNTIFLWSVLCLSVMLYGCQQKAQEAKKPTNQMAESATIPLPAVTENRVAEKPAVIYRSTDLGKTWSSFAAGIPTEATLSGIIQADHKLYVTTDYHGIFWSIDGQNDWQPLAPGQLRGLDINGIEVEKINWSLAL